MADRQDPHGTVDLRTGQDLRGHGPGIPPKGIIGPPHDVLANLQPVTLGETRLALASRWHGRQVTRLLNRLRLAGFPAAEFIASPNYFPGRGGATVDCFVQHTSVGSMQAAIDRFTNPAAQVSVTWALEAPRLVQFVPYDGGSYANGSWPYNMRSFTLERIDNGDYNSDATGPERQFLIVIYDHVYLDWGIPLVHQVPSGFFGHKEVPGSSTACPDGVNVDGLIADAKAALIETPEGDDDVYYPRDPADGKIYAYDASRRTAYPLTSVEWGLIQAQPNPPKSYDVPDPDQLKLLKSLPAPSTAGGGVDPVLTGKVDALSKHLGVGTA